MRRRPPAGGAVACLVAMGLAACSVAGPSGARITVTAEFSDVNALEHRATVEMNGVDVGVVSHIAVDGALARLTMSIKRSAHVPADVTPVIRQPSLLGPDVVELVVPAGAPAAGSLQTGTLQIGPLRAGAVLADAARPGRFQPDLETLVHSGTDLLGALGAEGTTALARVISEGAQGFGPEGGDLRAVLDDLGTVVSGYASRTRTIDTLLQHLDTFASNLGPSAQADAEAVTNLAATTAVLDRQKDRLIGLLRSLSAVSVQGSSLLHADLGLITTQLTGLESVTRGLADQQDALGRVLHYLNGHNLATSRGGDLNNDYLQVLGDFVVCGLPGGGEVATSPLDSCANVPQPSAARVAP